MPRGRDSDHGSTEPASGQRRLTQFGSSESQGLRDAAVLRATAHGRLLSEPPESAPNAPGWRKASTGRFIGYGLEDPNAKRDPETGRIAEFERTDTLSQREQRARYGDPDGGADPSTTATARSWLDDVQSAAMSRGIAFDPDLDIDDTPERAGVRTRAFDDDPARAGRTGLPQDWIDNLASGREADIAFTRAEDERSRDSRSALPNFESLEDESLFPDGEGLMPETSNGGRS